MHEGKLTRLFECYRSKNDLGALAEVFDAVSAELLRVARHVAGRGIDPEDLVQSTFLAAIERADTFDVERPLVPWLMGILINQ
jgi:DNA-directed RNA polymerase specialized sigma24 family protein